MTTQPSASQPDGLAEDPGWRAAVRGDTRSHERNGTGCASCVRNINVLLDAYEALLAVRAHLAQTAPEQPVPIGSPCVMCGPGYRIGDDGCRHGNTPEQPDAVVVARAWTRSEQAGDVWNELHPEDRRNRVRAAEAVLALLRGRTGAGE